MTRMFCSAFLASLLLGSSEAQAACSVSLVDPSTDTILVQTPTFLWTGTCGAYRLQFSLSPTFSTVAGFVDTQGRTQHAFTEATWESIQRAVGRRAVYWRVLGYTSPADRATSASRRFRVDPDFDDDGVSQGAGDCDDADPFVYPGAIDDPTDAVDQDCDPTTDDGDSDGWSPAFGDCDDADWSISPEAPEQLNGRDDNCNGLIDEESGGSIAPNLQTTRIAGVDYLHADGFAYPIGDGRAYTHSRPDDGWYVCTEFHEATSCAPSTTHLGEDWNAEDGSDQGDPVLAIGNGVVVEATRGSAGWGWFVVVRHDAPQGAMFTLPDGTETAVIVSFYAHLQNLTVVEGQAVTRGQRLAEIGPTAAGSSAPHLHFEIGWDLAQSYPGSGYAASTLGRVDPTLFLDANQTVGVVNPSVRCGGDFATIGDAVAAADPGAVVEVCGGTYLESNIRVTDTELTIRARPGTGAVVIDAAGVWNVFNVERSVFTLEDVEVTGGQILGGGGAMYLRDSIGAIRGCYLHGNTSAGSGGAIFARLSTVTVEDSELAFNLSNDGSFGGGGISVSESALTLIGTDVHDNTAVHGGGGLYALSDTMVEVFGGSFDSNDADFGGVMAVTGGARAELSSVNVADNTAWSTAGIYIGSDSALAMTGGTLRSNVASTAGGALGLVGPRSVAALTAVQVVDNYAQGGAAYMAVGAELTFTNCYLSNQGHQAGGVDLDGSGTLRSVMSDWMNIGDDVRTPVGVFNFVEDASFTCDGTGCR